MFLCLSVRSEVKASTFCLAFMAISLCLLRDAYAADEKDDSSLGGIEQLQKVLQKDPELEFQVAESLEGLTPLSKQASDIPTSTNKIPFHKSVPSAFYTFELQKGLSKEFYDQSFSPGAILQGYFWASGDYGEIPKVRFNIISPTANTSIFSFNGAESNFSVAAEDSGEYSYVFANAGSKKTVVYFAVSVIIPDAAGKSAPMTVETLASKIDSELKDIQLRSHYYLMKQKSQLNLVRNFQSRIFIFALLELGALLVVTFFQVFYIKNLVSVRRVF